MGWAEQTGHAVLWVLLVGFTGGIMAPFYVFALAQFVIRRTELVPTKGDGYCHCDVAK